MENEKKRQIETFPENYNNLLANIMFYRQHPVVNEVLLDYAISQTLIKRTDTSLHVTSPLEVEKGFLFNMISYHYILYIPSLSWFDHRLATSSLRRMRQLRGGRTTTFVFGRVRTISIMNISGKPSTMQIKDGFTLKKLSSLSSCRSLTHSPKITPSYWLLHSCFILYCLLTQSELVIKQFSIEHSRTF